MHHHVIGVVGASGGLGTSTLAMALAARAAPAVGAVACVDGDFSGGGLDVTAGLEHLAGPRWPDLAEARGGLDGAALVQALPREGPVAVLAARGRAPAGAVVDSALSALAGVCGISVVDLGRSHDLVSSCSHLVLVAGTTARHLADADAVAGELRGSAVQPVLALRQGRALEVPAEEVAVQLDVALAVVLQDDPRAPRNADRAAMPGTTGGATAAAADALLVELGVLSARGRTRRLGEDRRSSPGRRSSPRSRSSTVRRR
jgi:hypothetical protein